MNERRSQITSFRIHCTTYFTLRRQEQMGIFSPIGSDVSCLSEMSP